MKVFVKNEGLAWIIDSIVEDFKKHTKHTITDPMDAEIAWSVAMGHSGFIANLSCKKIVTFHHIDETKIHEYLKVFKIANMYIDACIVPNDYTRFVLSKYVNKPIYKIPYWVLDKRRGNFWTNNSNDKIIIGNFQRDSEGGSNKPKFSKGPDIFLDVVKELNKQKNIKVILTGKNRKYLIDNFEKEGIEYSYYEMVSDDELVRIFDSCEWVLVTSRTEGGPQTILEAPARMKKILSLDVGMAKDVLHPDCICQNKNEMIKKFINNVDKIKENFQNVNEFTAEKIIPKIDCLFERL